MRTFFIGLLGGALVLAFLILANPFDDFPCVEAGPVSFCPPQGTDLAQRLRELAAQERMIAGFEEGEEAAAVRANARDGEARVFAGRLIARPRRDIPSAEGEVLGDVRSFAARSGLDAAVEAAWEVGADVERVQSQTMVIALDYDITEDDYEDEGVEIEAVVAAPVEEGAAEETGVAGAVRDALTEGLAPRTRRFGFSERVADASRRGMTGSSRAVMSAVSRRRARLLQAEEVECPDDVTDEYVAEHPAAGVACAAERMRDSGAYEYVELDYVVTHQMERAPGPTIGYPDDPLLGLQWHYLTQTGEVGGAGFTDFWSREGQPGSREVVVAVIDTGLVLSHPEIVNSPNVAEGVDMVSVAYHENDDILGRDKDPNDPGDACPEHYGPYAEDSFHGTHVAGTVGAVATDDGEGVAGGAWEVTIVPVRALGRCGGVTSDVVDAIRWAAGVEPAFVNLLGGGTEEYWNPNPADIINLSLGFRTPSGCTRSMQDAINDAIGAGAIVVAAAGNESRDVSQFSPASCDGVVTVAAGDHRGELAWYSNWGDGVDILAPGGDMNADVDNDGRPDGVLSIRPAHSCRDPLSGTESDNCNYSYEMGTSMASPHVAAAFALLQAQYPGSSDDELISLIVDTARSPRVQSQCTGPCDSTPGGAPVDGEPGRCYRPCGSGLMDLNRAVRD